MKNKKELTKKNYIKLMILCLGLCLLFFALLGTAALLQENGVSSSIYTPIAISSFAVIVIDLVILFANLGRITEYELRVKAEKLANQKYEVIEGVTRQRVLDACEKQRFKQKDFEYYYKRKFSVTKDYVNYFIRCVDSMDLANDLDREHQKFDGKQYSNNNKCLILFFFLDAVTEGDLDILTDQATAFILMETAIQGTVRVDSSVAVLVDNSTRKAYMVPDRASISVYKHGINLVKRLLK